MKLLQEMKKGGYLIYIFFLWISNVKLALDGAERSGQLVVEAKNVAFSYADQPIVQDFSFRLMRGDVRLVLEEGTPVDDRGRPIAVANTNVAGPHEDARMTSR